MQFSDCIHDSLLLMTLPEIIAVATGIASVWFARKENILVYPVGIVSVLLYVYICLNVGLYADAAVNFYYFLVSIYGWYYWKHGGKFQNAQTNSELDSVMIDEEIKPHEEAEITSNSFFQNFIIFIITIGIGIALGALLDNLTDSTVPFWDGITTSLFITGMWLMAKKKIENWIYWVVGDAACIPLFLYKGLCLTSFQYLVFTILAIAGYLSWFSKLQKKSNQPA